MQAKEYGLVLFLIRKMWVNGLIVTKILGGLGNQIFQYAVARRLADVLGVPLKLDISDFASYKTHQYCLDRFRIRAEIASNGETNCLPLNSSFFSRNINRFFSRKLQAIEVIQEKYFHFDPEVLKLHDGVTLNGYWQSEKYFADVIPSIRNDLTPREPLSCDSKKMAELINSSSSVSVHIRRGDYISNPTAQKVHGVCSSDYYSAAVERIAKRVKEPHFFVFSDDIEWVRSNFQWPCQVTYVAHNGSERNYEDLVLMSLCQHHIIANSTFSWWGAWLSTYPGYPDKQVFAPKCWFAGADHDTSDLIPERWIRI